MIKPRKNKAAAVETRFQQAIGFHQQGDLIRADAIYREILASAPAHFDALHMLGVIALQRGQAASAVELIDRAIGINDKNAAAHSNRGNALQDLKRWDEALASYAHAIELVPESAQAHSNRGNALRHLKRFDEALASYARAIELNPEYAEAYLNRGSALQDLGRWDDALTSYARAVELAPDFAEAHFNRGSALQHLERLDEALASYARAIELRPDYAEACYGHGAALHSLSRHEEALTSYDRALTLKPDYAEVHFYRGNALQELGRLDEAVASYRRALAFKPDDADAHNNLGNVLGELGKPDEAVASYQQALCFRPDFVEALANRAPFLLTLKQPEAALESCERALEINPDHVDALVNRALVLLEMKQPGAALASCEHALKINPGHASALLNRGLVLYDMGLLTEACASYERALASDPGCTAAQYNLGLAHLSLHQFSSGFAYYERRIIETAPRAKLRANESVKLFEQRTRWQGPAVDADKTLAVWTEQGVGDQLVFATLIPDLVAAGTKFVYEIDRRLLPAFERSFAGVPLVAFCDPPAARLLNTDRVALAGSVPAFFRRTAEDFAKQPRRLLHALPDRVEHYRAQFALAGDGPRIALSWYSKRDDRLGSRKSAPLEKFAPLAEIPNTTLIDVQYGDTAAERREFARTTGRHLLHDDAVDYFNDLENILAMLDACDFLITTSNVNAHLAGALGKPVWLLYLADNTPFYYWAHDGNYRSLWYPSVRIVSAPSLHDWDTLIRHVAQMAVAYGKNPLEIPPYPG